MFAISATIGWLTNTPKTTLLAVRKTKEAAKVRMAEFATQLNSDSRTFLTEEEGGDVATLREAESGCKITTLRIEPIADHD